MAIVAIIGAGLIGRAWAIVFARAGHEVRIYDETAGAAATAVQFAASAPPCGWGSGRSIAPATLENV